ncbi:hypothetical protein GCM10009415_53820 [Chitinophaga japonensis]
MKQAGWIRVALINLAIVAGLGLLLRAKILFPVPVDFKRTLQGHSHFAFSGWITLALLALMVCQLLPEQPGRKRVYQWLLAGLLLTALGMLASFPAQGYGGYAILFSTLFIFVTYAFTIVFLKDFRTTTHGRAVKLLTVSSLASLVISSVGPYTLAYLMVSGSGDFVLYRNAIYTYLYLQHSGFFTLAVFALAFHLLRLPDRYTVRFAWLLVCSVIPAMFSSYLWGAPGIMVRMVALAGSVLSVLSLFFFCSMMYALRQQLRTIPAFAARIGAVAMLAFMLKMLLQALTVIPPVGAAVFANRPVVIGFLHLVLLAFVTVYLLAHFMQIGLLPDGPAARRAVGIFTGGVVLNEIVLMMQGLGVILVKSSPVIPWLLLGAAACLFTGSCLVARSALNHKHIAHEKRIYQPGNSGRDCRREYQERGSAQGIRH